MRWLIAPLIVLMAVIPAMAEDWTTADGKVYKDVTVIAQDEDGVRIAYAGGVGKIPYYELSVDLQKRFGQDTTTLAARKDAADKAQADAARNAAEIEQQRLRDAAQQAHAFQQSDVIPPTQPMYPGQDAAKGGAPGSAPHDVPGAASTGAPDQMPAAAAGAPGAIPASGAASSGDSSGLSPDDSPASLTLPAPAPTPGTISTTPSYHGSKYSFDDSLNLCYLDSYMANLWPDPLPAQPSAPGEGTGLTLRIITDGAQPQQPDAIEGIFLSVGSAKTLGENQNVSVLVDGKPLTVDRADDTIANILAAPGKVVESVCFTIPPQQARSMLAAREVKITVGGKVFKLDKRGIALFQRYFTDVDVLPPPSSSFVKTFDKIVARLPSIITMVSTTCEYIIFGGFGIVIILSAAAFVMGLTRFIKM